MKVAIIGAGLAGLSCAHELERYGLKPTVYEINSFIGEQFPHVGATLEIISRPVRDPLKYFKKSYDLDIKPLSEVNKIIHNSPERTTVIKGRLGYFFERSKEPWDMKNQLFSTLKKTKVLFNTPGDFDSLSKKFDYVVVANGRNNIADELGCWYEYLNTYVRGAVVLGNFDPGALTVWLNKDYCKNGYAYLAPFSEKKAALVLIATDITHLEIDHFWELFLYTENIKYPIIEEFKQNHRSGYVYPHKVNNLLFAGNAGGSIDPFLGFGILDSVVTGAMAAKSICENKDYEELIEWVKKRGKQLYEFRKSFDSLNNNDYTTLISSLGIPGLKHLIYYTPLNIVKLGAMSLRPINRYKKTKQD